MKFRLIFFWKKPLGKPTDTKTDEFLEKFQTGGGVISNPKIFVANLRFAEITSWIGWGTTFDLRKAEISETH